MKWDRAGPFRLHSNLSSGQCSALRVGVVLAQKGWPILSDQNFSVHERTNKLTPPPPRKLLPLQACKRCVHLLVRIAVRSARCRILVMRRSLPYSESSRNFGFFCSNRAIGLNSNLGGIQRQFKSDSAVGMRGQESDSNGESLIFLIKSPRCLVLSCLWTLEVFLSPRLKEMDVWDVHSLCPEHTRSNTHHHQLCAFSGCDWSSRRHCPQTWAQVQLQEKADPQV